MLAINEAYHGVCFVFFFQYYGDLPDLHSFPTRRSSDLEQLVTLPIDAVSHNRTIDYAVEIHVRAVGDIPGFFFRSEEHTSELQSHSDLVCRLLLEKKNNKCLRRTTPGSAVYWPGRTRCG